MKRLINILHVLLTSDLSSIKLGTTKISRFSLFDFFIVDSYIKGQLVRELGVTNYELRIGKTECVGKDENGKQVPNGIYLCKLSIGKEVIVKKMVLLR